MRCQQNNVITQQSHLAPYRCFVWSAQCPLHADSFPPSFFSCEWLVLPRSLIYSCDLDHTHTQGNEGIRVCQHRGCAAGQKTSNVSKITSGIMQNGLGWNAKGAGEKWTKRNWPDMKWEKLNRKNGGRVAAMEQKRNRRERNNPERGRTICRTELNKTEQIRTK